MKHMYTAFFTSGKFTHTIAECCNPTSKNVLYTSCIHNFLQPLPLEYKFITKN